MLLFFKKEALACLALLYAAPALAQTTAPDSAAAGNCDSVTAPLAPGEAPGGNVFAGHINQPQPGDLPNNETATYPDITQITPDSPDMAPIGAENLQYAPFPFSGGFNNPILSQGLGSEQSSTPKQGC